MSTPPVPPNIEEIIAPLMLGILWNWTLYGVLAVQLYVYSYNFPGDKILLKVLVYSVFLVETLQTALTGVDLYYWFISGFGNMDHLISPSLSTLDVPIIGSVISLTVQLFFVYRIWELGGRSRSSLFLCLFICLCSTVGTVAAFYEGIHVPSSHLLNFKRGAEMLASAWLIGNTLSDLLITGSMLFYLRRRRKGCPFSDHALSRVIRLTVETNVLTSTVGIVALSMFVIFPHKNWFTCPVTILGKLYSNTLFVSLNNRISIREGRGAVARSQAVALTPTTNSCPTVEIVQGGLKPNSGEWLSEDSASQNASRVFDKDFP